jgi:F-type H+-transporting ATPase subunit epsilon
MADTTVTASVEDESQNAAQFQFELVSPEKILVSERATMVIIPGEEGDFGVLPRHAPLLSSLRPGVVTITPVEGDVKHIFVAGGFADVNDNHCAVLAEEAIGVSELDRAALEEQLADLQDDLGFAKDDAVKSAHIRARIALTQAKIDAAAAAS